MDQTASGLCATDVDLLDRAWRADENAFLLLWDRHRTPLFRFACRLTGSVDTAEDVVHDCFLLLLSKRARFDARRGPLRSFLFGVVRKLVFKRLKASEREDDEPGEATAPPDQLGNLLTGERSQLVAAAVSALPPLQREALVLFEYEELSLEEISGIAGVEVGVVKARLHRAREGLRRRLSPLLQPGPSERSSR
jgi:RNA polymerase sigma-70 factor (ECF subfamily)